MGLGDSMRVGDRKIFARVAQGMGVWILVRGTNPASLEYICKKGYTPKPIDCKAKTAKKGPCAGLVVDPFKVADGFEDPTEPQKTWREEGNPMKHGERQSYYTMQTSGALSGCVKLDGDYIHGDYDLKAVVFPGRESATVALVTVLHGARNVRGLHFHEVQGLINSAIGSEMVQHGAEDEYEVHSEDTIFVFYPFPQNPYPLGSQLDGLAAIQSWYAREFQGRRTGDTKATGGVPVGVAPGIRGVVEADGSVRAYRIRKR